MGHGGQKGRLEPVRLLGLFHGIFQLYRAFCNFLFQSVMGLLQFHLCLFLLRDVVRDHHGMGDLIFGVAIGIIGHIKILGTQNRQIEPCLVIHFLAGKTPVHIPFNDILENCCTPDIGHRLTDNFLSFQVQRKAVGVIHRFIGVISVDQAIQIFGRTDNKIIASLKFFCLLPPIDFRFQLALFLFYIRHHFIERICQSAERIFASKVDFLIKITPPGSFRLFG